MQHETCRHVKEDGTYCGSPSLQKRKFCYYHLTHRARRLRRALALSRNEPYQLILPPLENLGSAQVALSEIVQALASGQLEPRTAGKMLYAIQQATTIMLRLAQMKMNQRADAKTENLTEEAASTSTPLREYPEFERNFDLPAGADLDAETDRAMVGAQEQLAALSVVPTLQPGVGRPVPAKGLYTRDEAYQMMQWEINRLRKQVREFQEERNQKFEKKQAASITASINTVTNSA